MRIRPAQPGDAAGIIAILNPIIETGLYTVLGPSFSIEQERSFIEQFPQRGIFHVAEEEGIIYGFQTVEPFASYTHAFDHVGTMGTYVHLGFQNQGIARLLFAATFAEARSKGYEKIFTFVRADNPGALRTYRSQGFEIIGTARRQAKVNGQYVDEVLIEKFLD